MSSTKNNRLNAGQAVIEPAGEMNGNKPAAFATSGNGTGRVNLDHKERILFMVERISEEHILKRIDDFVTLWYAKAK